MGVRTTARCTCNDASASTRWPPRAVATLLSADPYPDLHTRRFLPRPRVNSLRFSLMPPSPESAAAMMLGRTARSGGDEMRYVDELLLLLLSLPISRSLSTR